MLMISMLGLFSALTMSPIAMVTALSFVSLNPVEYLWAWLKRQALANFCPSNLDELNWTARAKLRRAQRRPSIIAACWVQPGLW